MLGGSRAGSPTALDGIAFVAQDTPLYKNLSVADMIYVTRSLNRRFDEPYAKARLDELGIPPKRKAGKLSGGQQAQLALTLALARRPRLLVLDEPVAMLDPVARHDFMATVRAAASADGVSVLLSSHVLTELERVANYLILLARGQVRLAGGKPVTCSPPTPGQPGRARRGLPARDPNGGGGAMTALTRPTRPDEDDAALRPVPWRRMAGVTWRQHRIALAGAAVLLGALAVWLWFAGTSLHHAYAAAIACRPAGSPACLGPDNTFNNMNHALVLSEGLILQVLPILIGAFAGAPALARELETGTFRYAWTQGFGRWRWALAKLVALAALLAAAGGAFGALLSWYYQPYVAPGNQSLGLQGLSPFAPGMFSLTMVGFAAWTLAAFAIGALAGMLIRRVVPAIIATLAVYTGLAIATGAFLRKHYLAPLVTSSPNVPGTAWIISQWSTRDGRFAFAGFPPTASSTGSALPFHRDRGKAGLRRKHSHSAWLGTATRSGPATSRPAGSGRSSGSRAAGCSRCRRCSLPRPSGWSNAAPPDASPPAAINPSGPTARETRPLSCAPPPHPGPALWRARQHQRETRCP